MGCGLVQNFHTRCLYQKSHSLAALARSISDTSPTRAKIPYAPPAHEVISIYQYDARLGSFCFVCLRKTVVLTPG